MAQKIDPELNLPIMNSIDFSGQNHYLLIDRDFKHNIYYKVYDSFTTSSYPWKGVSPIKISDETLLGKYKAQYLHIYMRPCVIEKTAVILDEITTIKLSRPEFQQILDTIKTD